MDLEYIENDEEESISLASVGYKPDTFAKRGIYCDGEAFVCLVCSKPVKRIQGIPMHIAGTQHCKRLETVNICVDNVKGHFACKLCTDYRTADWKALLCHFDEKKHSVELEGRRIKVSNENGQKPYFSYVTIVQNQIVEHDINTFYCCCCKQLIVGQNPTLRHISEGKHKRLQDKRVNVEYKGKLKESFCRRLACNFIYDKSPATFNCTLCDCSLNGGQGCWKHIVSREHIKNFVTRENNRSQSFPTNTKKNKNSTIPHSKSAENETLESFAKLMRDNSITGPSRNGKYHCKFCGVMLSGEKTIPSHVSGYQHKTSMQNSGKKLTTANEIEETSGSSSSSWVSTGNSSESWETYEGESESYDSYENSSYGWEYSDDVSDSWETISIQGSFSESGEPTLFEVPQNLVPLISKHYLQHLKKELFCTLCEAHLRSPQSILDHTRSKYHVAELNRHNDQIAKKNQRLSANAKKNTVVSSPTNVTNKTPSQPARKSETSNVTQKNVAMEVGRLELPAKLVPLISKHLLEYQGKEIFCPACEVRLQSSQSLVAHTKSTNHFNRLQCYKAEITQKQKNRADISGRSSTSSSFSNAIGKTKLAMSVNSKQQVSTAQKPSMNESHTSQSKLFKIPDYLIPVLARHYLQRLEREIVCCACQVRLLHVSNVIEHISSKNHMARLEIYKTEIANSGKNTAKIMNTNLAANSPMHGANNEKPSTKKNPGDATTGKTVTTSSQNPHSRLMHIPKKLLPLIEIHLLKHLENEIYCKACDVRIKHVTSLVSHTNSPRHTAKIQLLRADTLAMNKKIDTQVYQNKSVPLDVVKALKDSEMTKHKTPNKLNTDPNLSKLSSASGSVTSLEMSLNKLTIEEGKGEDSREIPQNLSNYLVNRSPRFKRTGKLVNTKFKKNRAFDPKYLKVDMQHIYEVNPEKQRTMELSCQLCFPKTSDMIYCLICEKSVASKLQNFYEHICSPAHIVYLAEAEKNHKHFIDYPDQFSDLTLAKEFMQEGTEDTIQCFACDASMQNDDTIIREHVNGDSHKEQKLLWNDGMERILQEMSVKMKPTWYKIQKYWCQPCNMEYNAEFHFAEHMESKKHEKCLKKIGSLQKKLVYDSCIVCATLWLGSAGDYAQHCEQPMHKYLTQTGDFYVFKLTEQTITLLENADAEVTRLVALSDQVSTLQKIKADTLLKCLEDTVKPVFPDAKAYPFGSRVSGLGFPDSDIDVFLDCGTYDGNNTTENYQEQLIISVAQCLNANQQSWEIEETLVASRTPIIKLRHRDTELSCDVSFKNGLSVENTKLLKCYIDNYPLCRKLMLFVKKWLSLCNLSGSQYITNYATSWYVIFFLQSKSIVPSVASLIAKENRSKIIDGWETGITNTFDVSEQEHTFIELLHGFFDFYTKFDFRYSVACPLLGRTVAKQDFTELDLLPKEMAPYANHVVTKSVDGLVELFRIDSEMCVQDPYDLSHNLTKAVRKYTLNRFKRLCAISADLLINFIQH